MKRKAYRVRKSFVVGMCVGLMILWASGVWAQERTKGFSEGLNLGIGRFSDGYLGTGFSGRVFLEYAPFIHEIALRLSGGYQHFKNTVKIGSEPFSSEEVVTFDDLYITGGAIYRFSRGKMVPFVTGNVGLYHYTKEDVVPGAGIIVDGVRMSPNSVIVPEEDNALGFNIGGGIEYFFKESRTTVSLEMLFHSIRGGVDREMFDVSVMVRFLPKKR
jgi:hypothetical protein